MRKKLRELKKCMVFLLEEAKKNGLTNIAKQTIHNIALISNLEKNASVSGEDVKEILQFYAKNPPFALFMADVKGLRQINNQYGRKYGDLLIASAQEFLQYSFRSYSSSRPSDVVLRYGEKADEFLAIAESTNERQARIIQARLNHNISNWIIQPLNIPLNLHVGYSIYNPEMTIEHLLENADREMRKNKGKL